MSERVPESARVVRFDLAIQRNHIFVYTIGLLTGLAAWRLRVFPLDLRWAFLVWAMGCVSAAVFYFLFRAGINRRILNPLWLTANVVFVTMGVYASGGVQSPWFIWYIAAYLVSIGNTVAYITTLLLMGQVSFWDEPMLLALCRMLFIFGATYL